MVTTTVGWGDAPAEPQTDFPISGSAGASPSQFTDPTFPVPIHTPHVSGFDSQSCQHEQSHDS